jgi:hypothetical protein
MELYNSEYLVLKSMGFGVYLTEFMSPSNSRKIPGIEMRSKILDMVGLNIKEIITDLSVSNYAFIMTTNGAPMCNIEKGQILPMELAYLDEATQISSQEFLDRVKLIRDALSSI